MPWSSWKKWPVQTLPCTPAVVKTFIVKEKPENAYADRIDIFKVGIRQEVQHVWSVSDAWKPERSLGGVVTSALSAIAASPGRFDVFGRGTNGSVYHRWVLQSGEPAGDWQSLGGTVSSAPSAVKTITGQRLDVFARGTNNQLYHAWSKKDRVMFEKWDGSWHSRGGELTSAPAATADDGFLFVFARGTNGGIYCRCARQKGNDFLFDTPESNWQDLEVPVHATFTTNHINEATTDHDLAAGNTGTTVFVCAIGSDDRIYCRSHAYRQLLGSNTALPLQWKTDRSLWQPLPSLPHSNDPASKHVFPLRLTASGPHLYVLGTDFHLYQTFFTPGPPGR